MRKLAHDVLCITLSLALILMGTGCANQTSVESASNSVDAPLVDEEIEIDVSADDSGVDEFSGLGDQALLRYIEDATYDSVVRAIDTDEYLVDSVKAVYVSQEYLDELAYNSQANIYFGYTLGELEEAFQGKRYVFAVDENGKTIVKAFEAYDDTYDLIIRNVAVGTGVILVCVTLSAVTAGAGVPAASWIFAVGAENATKAATFSAMSGGAISAMFTGLQGGSVDDILKSAAIGASESFKWGAIFGSINGIYGETTAYRQTLDVFKDVELAGLSPQDAALIQRKSKYPLDVIKQFKSVEEFDVYYKTANLKPAIVNNKTALVQDIDLDFEVTLKDGITVTNRQLMENGNAPYYFDKVARKAKQYQLHHIGQKNDATLAVLTEAQHTDYSKILHLENESEINRNAFNTIRKKFWQSYIANIKE